MFDFICGIAVGAVFSPFWMMVGKAIWSRGQDFLEKYRAGK